MIEINFVFSDGASRTYYLDYKNLEVDIQISESEFEHRTMTESEARDAIVNDIINKRYLKLCTSNSPSFNKEIFVNTEYVKEFSLGN